LKVTLSLWDIGGQERFNFFKTDFFRGTAAVGLVWDISRSDTFEKLEIYINDMRKRSGNIPIFLVGNKSDLKETLGGQTIPYDKIINKVNNHNLIGYIETSALKNINVEKLFKNLSLAALFDLKPRLGEISIPDRVEESNHFRFKILLIGDAGVGKSSLIKVFVNKDVDHDYKITVGLDLMTQHIDIPDDELPKEAIRIINEAISKSKKRLRKTRWKERS